MIENEDDFRVGISSIIEYHFCGINVEVSFRRMKCHTGVLSSFCNGLVRKTPPERGIFFRGQYERKGISPVELYERVAAHLVVSFGKEPITRTEQLQ